MSDCFLCRHKEVITPGNADGARFTALSFPPCEKCQALIDALPPSSITPAPEPKPDTTRFTPRDLPAPEKQTPPAASEGGKKLTYHLKTRRDIDG